MSKKNVFLILLLILVLLVAPVIIYNISRSKVRNQGLTEDEAFKSYPAPPENFTAVKLNDNNVKIMIEPDLSLIGYHIFKHCTYLDETPTIIPGYSWRLIGVISNQHMIDGKVEFIDNNIKPEKCLYSITSFNSWGNESSKSSYQIIEKTN